MFHNLLLLMFDVLVKSFVLVEVKATTLTLNKKKVIFSLFFMFLQIMKSSGLDLIKFTLNFQFKDVLLNYFILPVLAPLLVQL